MVTSRLYLREEGTSESADSVLLSRTPQAGAVLMADPRDGQQPISLDVMLWDEAVAAADTDETFTSPILLPRGIVPLGWKANIYSLLLYTHGGGVDITSFTAKLFVTGGTIGAEHDESANFGVLSVVPTSGTVMASALPVTAPYVIDATSTLAHFTTKYTTNGTLGTMQAVVHVLGYMYLAV